MGLWVKGYVGFVECQAELKTSDILALKTSTVLFCFNFVYCCCCCFCCCFLFVCCFVSCYWLLFFLFCFGFFCLFFAIKLYSISQDMAQTKLSS